MHAQANDAHTSTCRALLRAKAAGHIVLRLIPLVLHELTYVLPHYVKTMTRADAVLIRRAQDHALPIWSRNHRDFTRYDLPNSTWPIEPA